MPESAAIVRRFDQPDGHRDFPLGAFDLVTIGGMSVGRAVSIHFLGADRYATAK
jgi:hypothetical protein